MFPSPSRALSLPEDAPGDAGRSEVPGWAPGGPANGTISAVTAAVVTLEGATSAAGNGPGCGGPRARRSLLPVPAPVPVPVPVPAGARCRPPVSGAALALPRSPFSLVFAIRPNLLRQEVQMSPNCFHSGAVFSSEAVVQENEPPLPQDLLLLSLPPSFCFSAWKLCHVSQPLATFCRKERDIFSISVSASELRVNVVKTTV